MKTQHSTNQKEDEIIKLHSEGHTCHSISKILTAKYGRGFSDESILRYFRRNGLKSNHSNKGPRYDQRKLVSKEVEDRIIALHHEGYGAKLTARLIESELGVVINHTTISYHRKRLGLKPHIGSPNGGLAVNGKTRIQKQVEDFYRSQKREMCERYKGFRDLPLFSCGNRFKMKYRNDPDFRSKQIERAKQRKKTHPEENRASVKRWRKKPENKVIQNFRNRLSDILKGRKGYSKTAIIKGVGCTREELIKHIESQFEEGMSWDNYGEWHIDHIIPLAAAKTECLESMVENLKYLNHYSNLRPLWAAENIAKGASLPPGSWVLLKHPMRVQGSTA